MGIAEDAVVLPNDGAVLPAPTLSAILESDAYPESTGFTRTIEYVDFEMHGKPFTQVVMTLRPDTPRLHDGKEILLIAGEGGSDNGNGFLATYEGNEGIGPWIAKRGITFAAVPRLGRWNFFAPDQNGSWADIPLGDPSRNQLRHCRGRSAAPRGLIPVAPRRALPCSNLPFRQRTQLAGNPLTGGQNRIRHSDVAETRNKSDRSNRRDRRPCCAMIENSLTMTP